jgi:hypothetical protein
MFQVEVFRVVTPCSVVVGYQCSRDPCCLHLHGEVDDGIMDFRNVGVLPQSYTASQPRILKAIPLFVLCMDVKPHISPYSRIQIKDVSEQDSEENNWS